MAIFNFIILGSLSVLTHALSTYLPYIFIHPFETFCMMIVLGITDTLLDWGVHGVSYVVFDSSNNAGVCSFRLYNRGEQR